MNTIFNIVCISIKYWSSDRPFRSVWAHIVLCTLYTRVHNKIKYSFHWTLWRINLNLTCTKLCKALPIQKSVFEAIFGILVCGVSIDSHEPYIPYTNPTCVWITIPMTPCVISFAFLFTRVLITIKCDYFNIHII